MEHAHGIEEAGDTGGFREVVPERLPKGITFRDIGIDERQPTRMRSGQGLRRFAPGGVAAQTHQAGVGVALQLMGRQRQADAATDPCNQGIHARWA